MLYPAAADLRRKRSHYVLNHGFVEKYVKVPLQLGTLAVLAYRFEAWTCRAARGLRAVLRPLGWAAAALSATLCGVRINPATPIGGGFIIHNFSGIFVDAEAIGEDFTINQAVSVGPEAGCAGRPRIGDNVYIGAGAKVLGDITIGRDVVIAANALVCAAVPDGCTVAGVPARIIARGATSHYLQLRRDG
jgi:serine O-acetyltransferase